MSIDNQCIVSRFVCGTSGYPQIGIAGKTIPLHRLVYRIFNGPIKNGMCICHSCDNKQCINPKHLWMGSQADNLTDMYRKNRGRNGKNYYRGEKHPLAKLSNDDVLYIRSNPPIKFGDLTRLAKRFGVTKQSIFYILKGKTWKMGSISKN